MSSPSSFQKYFKRLWPFVLSILLLSACQGKDPLPQPEFPLDEESISSAIAEQGLDWTIDQTQPAGSAEGARTVGLIRPESGKDHSDLILTTEADPEGGRRLSATLIVSKNELLGSSDVSHSWTEWEDILVLSARLYGGFEHEKELYDACSETELPLDSSILFQQQLTGGYCRVSVSAPLQEWTPYHNGVYVYRLALDIVEAESAL